jgi:formylglycine-generating enzyme required for sulfatase activity
MISLRCGHCGENLEVKDELAGKRGKCPACGRAIAIPVTSEQLATATSEPGMRLPVARHAEEKQHAAPPQTPGSDAATRAQLPGNAAPEMSPTAGGETVGYAPVDAAGRLEAAEGTQQRFVEFLAPPEQPDEMGRLGPFRVLRVLGTGGMGVVYKADDPQLKRPVALKAMLPSLAASESGRRRFLLEAQAAATVVHDHIVPILQVGEDRGVPFIAMPYLEGEPLDKRLKREGRLPVPEVLRIGREVAGGLAAAHEKGLIHRDVKPANIWLEGNRGRVKILDFGLARAAGADVHLTQSGAILGTPAFMAPEQAEGLSVDHRCDLFSLGCVLYRMCTGRLPFEGDSALAILRALALTEPEPPCALNDDVPRPLSDLVMQLLAKNPEQRPQSAQAVAEKLFEMEARAGERARGQTTQDVKVDGTTRMGAAPARSAHAGKKRPSLVRLVAVGALCLGLPGFVLFLLLRAGPHQAPPGDAPPDARQTEALPQKFTNGLGMEFVLVPRGKSWLGGGGGKAGDREVEIKEDFYLGKYEVTQQEWEKVTGKAPSTFKAVAGVAKEDQKRFPVESVSWEDAQAFLKRLNATMKEPGWVYRLPKVAEWEYACRGGPLADKLASAYDFYLEKPTNRLSLAQANFSPPPGKGLLRTCKVGSYRPNPLGLYDMYGNVWEWCDDVEQAAGGASQRVLRGGCWYSASGSCRTANRIAAPPSYRFMNIGVRLARVPAEPRR